MIQGDVIGIVEGEIQVLHYFRKEKAFCIIDETTTTRFVVDIVDPSVCIVDS
jgi:hypothetical protein